MNPDEQYTDNPREPDFVWKYEDDKFFIVCVCGNKLKQPYLSFIRCPKCHRERKYHEVV
jgi:hypothetical protein